MASLSLVEATETVEGRGFRSAVAQFAIEREALLQAGQRLVITALSLIDLADVEQPGCLTAQVSDTPGDRQTLPLVGQRLLVPSLRLMNQTQVGQAGGLTGTIAHAAANRQALLQASHRVLVTPEAPAPDAEVAVDLCLPDQVALTARDAERDLIDLRPVIPVATHEKEGVQRVSQLHRDLVRNARCGRCCLLDGGDQVAPLGVQPLERGVIVTECQAAAPPALVDPFQAIVTWT